MGLDLLSGAGHGFVGFYAGSLNLVHMAIYVGISPDTNKPIYAAPADASLTMTFNQAKEYAANLDAYGHQDWRIPTKEELKVLFNNLSAIDGFNLTGSYPPGWYWSAKYDWGTAWGQRFSDGSPANHPKDTLSSALCQVNEHPPQG